MKRSLLRTCLPPFVLGSTFLFSFILHAEPLFSLTNKQVPADVVIVWPTGPEASQVLATRGAITRDLIPYGVHIRPKISRKRRRWRLFTFQPVERQRVYVNIYHVEDGKALLAPDPRIANNILPDQITIIEDAAPVSPPVRPTREELELQRRREEEERRQRIAEEQRRLAEEQRKREEERRREAREKEERERREREEKEAREKEARERKEREERERREKEARERLERERREKEERERREREEKEAREREAREREAREAKERQEREERERREREEKEARRKAEERRRAEEEQRRREEERRREERERRERLEREERERKERERKAKKAREERERLKKEIDKLVREERERVERLEREREQREREEKERKEREEERRKEEERRERERKERQERESRERQERERAEREAREEQRRREEEEARRKAEEVRRRQKREAISQAGHEAPIIDFDFNRDTNAIKAIITESPQMKRFIALGQMPPFLTYRNIPSNTKVLRMPAPDGKLIGFITYYMGATTRGNVTYLGVAAPFRGFGFGRRLLQHALDDLVRQGANEVELWVRPDNPAKKLYTNMGFKEIGPIGKPPHSIVMHWTKPPVEPPAPPAPPPGVPAVPQVPTVADLGIDPSTNPNAFAAYEGQLNVLQDNLQGITDAQVIHNLLIATAKLDNGMTPLHLAAMKGNTGIITFLMSKQTGVPESELNPKDNQGNTPLHYAAMYGHVDAVRLLLAADANYTLRNNQKQRPIDVARTDEIRKLLNYYENLARQNLTPLIAAAGDRKVKDVRFLVENYANLNAHDAQGNTALHHAIITPSLEIVNILLTGRLSTPTGIERTRPNIDARNVDGETPLHFAVKLNRPSIIQALLDARANVAIANNVGLIAQDLAETLEQPWRNEIIAIFRARLPQQGLTRIEQLITANKAAALGVRPAQNESANLATGEPLTLVPSLQQEGAGAGDFCGYYALWNATWFALGQPNAPERTSRDEFVKTLRPMLEGILATRGNAALNPPGAGGGGFGNLDRTEIRRWIARQTLQRTIAIDELDLFQHAITGETLRNCVAGQATAQPLENFIAEKINDLTIIMGTGGARGHWFTIRVERRDNQLTFTVADSIYRTPQVMAQRLRPLNYALKGQWAQLNSDELTRARFNKTVDQLKEDFKQGR